MIFNINSLCWNNSRNSRTTKWYNYRICNSRNSSNSYRFCWVKIYFIVYIRFKIIYILRNSKWIWNEIYLCCCSMRDSGRSSFNFKYIKIFKYLQYWQCFTTNCNTASNWYYFWKLRNVYFCYYTNRWCWNILGNIWIIRRYANFIWFV